MNEILCVATFDIICSSTFQTKCVNYSMQTSHHVMPMAMENLIIVQNWDNFNMPMFGKVVISLKFVYSSEGIMLICNIQH
jgi:hypothetical protein